MDYPQLNLLFGLALILTLVTSVCLRVLLSKAHLPAWQNILSWVAMVISILSALLIEYLFLQRMTPAFNRQVGLWLLLIGGVGILITTLFSQRAISPLAASIMFWVQILVSLISVVLAAGLYRSLVPV